MSRKPDWLFVNHSKNLQTLAIWNNSYSMFLKSRELNFTYITDHNFSFFTTTKVLILKSCIFVCPWKNCGKISNKKPLRERQDAKIFLFLDFFIKKECFVRIFEVFWLVQLVIFNEVLFCTSHHAKKVMPALGIGVHGTVGRLFVNTHS